MKKAVYYMPFLFYPNSLKHPFNIIYLPNLCEASSNSILLPSNDQIISEKDSWNLSNKCLNFENRYEKVSDFSLMQAYDLGLL